MKRTAIAVATLLVFMAIFVFAAGKGEKPETTIWLLSKAMPLDCNTAAWKACGIKPIELNTVNQVAVGKEKWKKQTAQMYIGYDDKNLYVLADVKTPSPLKNYKTGKDIYNGDNIEVFLGFNNSDPDRQSYLETDYQIGVSTGLVSGGKTKTKPEAYCFNLNQSIEAKIMVKPKSGGYILEAAIPVSAFSGWDMSEGKEIGFDIGFDDNGSGKTKDREIQMTWSGDKDGWQNPAGWGKAAVKKAVCK